MPQLTINIPWVYARNVLRLLVDFGRQHVGEKFRVRGTGERRFEVREYNIRHLILRVEFNRDYTGESNTTRSQACVSRTRKLPERSVNPYILSNLRDPHSHAYLIGILTRKSQFPLDSVSKCISS
jgi:hypothetical protein